MDWTHEKSGYEGATKKSFKNESEEKTHGKAKKLTDQSSERRHNKQRTRVEECGREEAMGRYCYWKRLCN